MNLILKQMKTLQYFEKLLWIIFEVKSSERIVILFFTLQQFYFIFETRDQNLPLHKIAK